MEHIQQFISQEQLNEHKRALKQAILWCIFYREEEFRDGKYGCTLNSYMETLQAKFCALNALFGKPVVILDILEFIEAARQLYSSERFNCRCEPTTQYQTFRKYILDARALVDKISISQKEGDDNGFVD